MMPSAIAPLKDSAKIPVIDISHSNPNAAHDILEAAIKFGFVYVENNQAAEMPPADVAGMFNMSKSFFQSPKEVKETCSIHSNESGKNRGWLSMHTEFLDPGNQKRGDFKEAFNIGEIRNGNIEQPLPPPLSTNSQDLSNFALQCHNLCNRVMQLFAVGLGISEDWFSDRHDQSKGPSGSILRLLYYPSVPDTLERDEEDIRAGAHSDYGSVTLLFQLPGQPGLELLTPEGSWVSVPVDPSGTLESDPSKPLPILVNIGDLLAYWTNGLLKSTVHRVIFPKDAKKGGEDRYSIAYFCHPLDDARLVTVPSKLVEEYKGGVKGLQKNEGTMTARDHLNERLAATYGMKS